MRVRRVVVRLDTGSPSSHAVLAAAVALAIKLEVELVGLFVEDANLLHFAAFPFAHEVGFPSATRRPLDVSAMERVLRSLAEDARRALALAARESTVRWSFEVTRGSEVCSFLAAVTDADLVIASMLQPQDLDRVSGIRVVRAGDPNELRAALELDESGILVLAGPDGMLVGETLRKLLAP